jgi:response regulator of citrate/malate metabolism
MSDTLDVIIVDDDPSVCLLITKIVQRFYSWGQVQSFTDAEAAISFCRKRKSSVAIFILDVFMGEETGFGFLEAIVDKYPLAYQDCIIVTGQADEDVVNMCLASDITYLIEKPIRAYTLQLAVRAIVTKYIKFAKRILRDPVLAENIKIF